MKADIECLLNTIGKSAARGDFARALEASAQLHDIMANLQREDMQSQRTPGAEA